MVTKRPSSSQLLSIDIERIMTMIPHRYPFLLVDRVQDMIPNQSAIGIKNVTFNEHYFHGHFPSAPVMPGVLIIESMAQTSALLVVQSLGAEAEGKLVYFMSIDGARFRNVGRFRRVCKVLPVSSPLT